MNNRIINPLRRKMGELSIRAFAEIYFRHYLKYPASSFHRELYKSLKDISGKRNHRLAIAAPRGIAKSSIISMIYVIWSICYKKEEYILLISDTKTQAETFMEAIKKELETNRLLIEDFPEICEIGQKPKPPRWKKSEIITRNNIKVTVAGASQRIRGIKHGENRPTLVILDDIENDESTQSPERREKLFNWFTKAVLKIGSPITNYIVVGTIQHYDSLLAKLTSGTKMPGWQKRIYKSVISLAKNEWLWKNWADIYNYDKRYSSQSGPEAARRYFLEHKEIMLKGTKVLWPEKEDYYSLMVMRENDGHASFDSEKQNEPIDPKEQLFNPDEFHYWDDKYDTEEELLNSLGEEVEFYMACDPSLGKKVKNGDYSAIILLARNKENGKVYVLVEDIKNRTPDELIKDLLGYCARRICKIVAVEANQFQEYLANEIQKRLNASGIYAPIEKVVHSTNKKKRIQSMQPFIKDGTIQFSRRQRMLIEQLKYFPKGAHDDGPDALEMAFQICKQQEENKVVVLPLNLDEDDW